MMLFGSSVELQCPRLNLEVLRKSVNTDGYRNSSPRYSVRTTMLALYLLMKFLRFPSYKISITLK